MNLWHLVFGLALAPLAVQAADFSDPTWPCIQPKVENLSPGLMWPAVVDPAPLTPAARDLVAVLALRRIGLDAAEEHIRSFVAANPGVDAQVLGNVFLGVFDRLAADRKRLIAGIGRYAESQTALAAKVETARSEMDQLMAAPAPDFDRIDTLEEQIDWEERIYHDRARSLTYVCESPVLLEKRAYAIAQLLLKAVPE